MSNWIHIASFINQIDMISAKDLLEENNINCVMQNTWDSERYTIIATSNNGGKLFVKEVDYLQSFSILELAGYGQFVMPSEDPFVSWFRKHTNRIPILNKISIGFRLLLILFFIGFGLIAIFYMAFTGIISI